MSLLSRSLKENLLISLKDFQKAFELKAKQYEINLPNRGYDIHAMCKELYSLLTRQKPAEWSEDDQSNFNELSSFIFETYRTEDASRLISWLNSIKDRVLPQLKQEWSEEDELMHKTIILNLKVQMENCAVPSKDSLNNAIGWFQKLKHQRTFVPSEEEMKALEFCLEHNIDKDGVFESKVVKLYKQLKNLREK